ANKKDKRGIVELNNGYDQYYGGYDGYYGNDYQHQVTNHVTVTKKVAVPYPVPVEKQVPVAVKVPVPVHVEKQVPVVVEKKVPVYIEKKVPVHVDRPYPVPVKVPVKVPVYHKQVVEVAKPYPVPIEKSYPVYVKEPQYIHKTVPSTVYEHDSSVYGSPVSYDHKPLQDRWWKLCNNTKSDSKRHRMTTRNSRGLTVGHLATVLLIVVGCPSLVKANASDDYYDDVSSREGTIEEVMHHSARSTPESSSYVVSVVEFHPEPMTMPIEQRTQFHLTEYSRLIRSPEAKPADIIVFPELTLNSLSDTVFVPDPAQRIAPCDDHGTILVTLSCLAREVSKYLVINLSEQFYLQHQAETVRYNTDVVFDRNGTVIARYRKYNLFKEPGTSITSSPELVSFETDFGVHFGVFTCFDILFALPTLELVKHGLRDFVFPAFWTSEPPFLTSTQIFESWAYANDANLIVAGTNYGPSGATGTGVFNGRNGALLTHYTGQPTRAVYTVTVPKSGLGNITRYHSLTSDVLEVPIAEPTGHRLPGYDLENVRLGRDFLEQFTTIQLNPIWQQDAIGQIVCSGMFCCDFSLSLTVDNDREQTHHYRLAVFDGVRTFQGFADAHVSICGVIACANQSIASCGLMLRHNSEYLQFNSISITGQFIANGTLAMPSTLDMRMYSYDASHYGFTAEINYSTNVQIVTMNLTTPISDMQTFGIYAFNHKEFEFYNPIERPGTTTPEADPDDDGGTTTGKKPTAAALLLAGVLLAVRQLIAQ
uniref:CN hydrolase domain-containing protein n=1 Tax=Anopheles epiroticus TaxID=199890 RepID=A0A182PVD4_9DIPT